MRMKRFAAAALVAMLGMTVVPSTKIVKAAHVESAIQQSEAEKTSSNLSKKQKKKIEKAYRKKLKNLRKTGRYYSFCGSYTIYDIENDGIPECIADNYSEAYSGDHNTYIYSWNKGKVNTVVLRGDIDCIKGDYITCCCGAATGSRVLYWHYTGNSAELLMDVVCYTNETGEEVISYSPNGVWDESYTEADFLRWKESLGISDIEQNQYFLSTTEITTESIKKLKVE